MPSGTIEMGELLKFVRTPVAKLKQHHAQHRRKDIESAAASGGSEVAAGWSGLAAIAHGSDATPDDFDCAIGCGDNENIDAAADDDEPIPHALCEVVMQQQFAELAPKQVAKMLWQQLDHDRDGQLTAAEVQFGIQRFGIQLLPNELLQVAVPDLALWFGFGFGFGFGCGFFFLACSPPCGCGGIALPLGDSHVAQ